MGEKGYQGRLIQNNKFLESLLKGNLRKMLDVVIDDKNNLDLQIRGDYLNVYYLGGNIAKIYSEKSVHFDEYYFYRDHVNKSKKEILDDPTTKSCLIAQKQCLVKKFKSGLYEEYFDEAKKVMKEWFEINPKPERLEQQNITKNNGYGLSDYVVLDIEYQVSSICDFACTYIPKGKSKPKNPRFDIIAINKENQICVIELKKGVEALSSTSGLKEHYDCYQNSIGANYHPFLDEMKILLKQKQDFGLIPLEVKIKSEEPIFMFAYAYDNKSEDYQKKKFQQAYEGIGEKIPVIKMSNEYRLLASNLWVDFK